MDIVVVIIVVAVTAVVTTAVVVVTMRLMGRRSNKYASPYLRESAPPPPAGSLAHQFPPPITPSTRLPHSSGQAEAPSGVPPTALGSEMTGSGGSSSNSLGMNSSFSNAEVVSDFGFDETVVATGTGEETILTRAGSGNAWLLNVTDPAGATWQIQLEQSVVVIGRQPQIMPSHMEPHAQLISVDESSKTLSKTHAKAERYEGRWWLTDLGSTNGTVVSAINGRDLEVPQGHTVPVDTQFMLGDVVFRFVEQEG